MSPSNPLIIPSLPLCFLTSTEDLKIAMAAETNAWKVLYGRNMNTKYLSLMEQIMEQIDDMSRRLSRPIKDLDDIRQAMATLKEIRENEIYIDSCLGPVEVWIGSLMCSSIFLHISNQCTINNNEFFFCRSRMLY